jgi:restriction system protein
MINYFAKNPEKMKEMNPRKFEELVAAIFRNQGFGVALTPQTRDGGYDILAVKHDKFTGNEHYLIECKRYAEHNRIGVGVVRSLMGVLQMNNATKGIIATTSFFTRDAEKLALNHSSRLMLHDYDAIKGWLAEI